jgi:hypothetical protein
VRGRTSCAGEEKKIKRRIIGEGSSTAQEGGAQQNYVPPFGGILALPSYYGGVPIQEWGSGAAMPHQICGIQRSLCGAICTPSSTTKNLAIIGGYAARNMQIIAAIQTNANQMSERNANIAYELGRLHLAPPGQFIGVVQSYYEQGYTNKDYQYQPPMED